MSERQKVADALRALRRDLWERGEIGVIERDVMARASTLLATPEWMEDEKSLVDTLRWRFPLAYAAPTSDAGVAGEDVVERGKALATYFAGCLKGKPHPDDASAFPATIREGDWRTVLDLLAALAPTHPTRKADGEASSG